MCDLTVWEGVPFRRSSLLVYILSEYNYTEIVFSTYYTHRMMSDKELEFNHNYGLLMVLDEIPTIPLLI